MNFKFRGKRYSWQFANMSEVLQILAFIIGGSAIVGWMLIGTWLLWAITI